MGRIAIYFLITRLVILGAYAFSVSVQGKSHRNKGRQHDQILMSLKYLHSCLLIMILQKVIFVRNLLSIYYSDQQLKATADRLYSHVRMFAYHVRQHEYPKTL